MAGKKNNSVEGLKEKLYSRTEEPEVHPEERTPLTHEASHVPVAWEGAPPPPPVAPAAGQSAAFHGGDITKVVPMARKKKTSFAVKFFLASVAFFLVAGSFAAYVIFFDSNTISPQNIDMQIIAPSLIDGGKETTLQILINNRNPTQLQLVDLVIDYPEGTRDPADQTKVLARERQTVGAIDSGQQIKRTAAAVFYGQEGMPQKVRARLEYTIPGSNAIFEKETEVDFLVGSSPVSVSIDSPTNAVAGQEFPITLTIQSNATTPVEDVVIQGQYPFGFSILSAMPAAEAGDTIWRLGKMEPGTSKVIKIIGKIEGQDGDQRVFRFLAGSDGDQTNTQIKVPFLTVPQTLTVERPFISATIAIAGQSGKTVAVPAGATTQGSISWQNNLPDSVSDVEIRLSMAGATLDRSSIQSPDGFYQSKDDVIVWTKDQLSTLADVPPGGSGVLRFSFTTTPPGAGGVAYTNPTLNFNVSVAGVRQGQDKVPEKVASAATAEVQVSSIVGLTAQALYSSGAFVNTGPVPPVAEQTTTYNIVWTLSNSSNTIANATVSAVLPTYVRFVAAQPNSGVQYNASSRTVTWAAGDLKAGVGYTAQARTATFQVALTPSTSQIGQAPMLTGDPQFSGQDRFAQVPVQVRGVGPTTLLVGDANFQGGTGQVVPKQ